MKGRFSVLFTLLLMIGDALAVIGAYSIAFILRVKISDVPIKNAVAADTFLESLLLLLPFVIFIFGIVGLYRTVRHDTVIKTAGKLLLGAFFAMLFMVFIDYFHPANVFPAKKVLIYGFGLSIILLVVERSVLYLIKFLRHRGNYGLPGVLIIGDNDVAKLLVQDIERPTSNYRLQGVVGDGRLKWTTHKTFEEAVANFRPHIIIQVTTSEKPKVDTKILKFAQENYIDFKFVPSDINDLSDHVEMELFMGDVPMMSVEPTRLVGWGRFGKRLFDIVISLLAIIIFSPILLIVYIAEKIADPKANAIFHQTRLTRGDHEFQLYKFRSQYQKYDGTTPEQAFKMMGKPELIKQYRDNGDSLPNDPRITPVGRVIRKISVDELPQLFNVLRGDISLVGPRALIPQELNKYEKKHLILNVKSGITGLAQISGRRDLPFEQRRKLDVYYVQNWSFWLDVQILFKTAWQVLTGKGAE
ncbi:MAG: sugar transferase [Candidatus Saccharibacteria bacterium]|nr:sugar transferase [Candidatus Saccharibacteria bacterium]